jgi:hypothetical protein
METWQILLLIALGLALVFFFFNRKKVVTQTKVANNNSVLGQLSKAVPAVGYLQKAVGVVEKPVAQIFNSVNNTLTAGLQHIPVAGKYLAMPTKAVGTVVNDVLKVIGF